MQEEFKLTKEQRKEVKELVNRYMRIKFKREFKKIINLRKIKFPLNN